MPQVRAAIPVAAAPAATAASSEALIDGSMTVTPAPHEPTAATPREGEPKQTGARWSFVFIALFAVLGILLGARSLLGRDARQRAEASPTVLTDIHVPPAETEAIEEAGISVPAKPAEQREKADPFRAANRQATPLVGRPAGLDREDFEALADRAAAGLRVRPDDPSLGALAAYADGGLAYARGDDADARRAIDRALDALGTNPPARGLPAWLSEGRTAGEMADWEVAAIYGDARGLGLPLVEKQIEEDPRDFRAHMGRALLLHMDDRHEDAIAQALEVRARVPESNPAAAAQVLRFVADEYAELGRWSDAVQAYTEVVELGGPTVAQAGVDGGRIALEKLGDVKTARAMFRAACEAGNELACRGPSAGRTGRPRRARR
jgi:hypothetical protein